MQPAPPPPPPPPHTHTHCTVWQRWRTVYKLHHLDSHLPPLPCLGSVHLSQAGCSDGLRVKLCKHFRRLLLKILQEQLLYLPKQPQKSCTPACKIYALLIWQISPPGLRWSPQCINTWETKTSNTRSPVLKEQKTMHAQPHVVSACVCYIYMQELLSWWSPYHTPSPSIPPASSLSRLLSHTLFLHPSPLSFLFPLFLPPPPSLSHTFSLPPSSTSLSCSLCFLLLPPPPSPPSFPVPAISSFSPLSLSLWLPLLSCLFVFVV